MPLGTLLVSVLFALAGAWLALLVASALIDPATLPRLNNHVVPTALYQMLLQSRDRYGILAEAIGPWAALVSGSQRWVSVLLLLAATWALVRLGNRDNRSAFRRHPLRTWAARVVAMMLALPLAGLPLILAIDPVTDAVGRPGGLTTLNAMAAVVFLGALLFLVMGEGGWISSLAGAERALNEAFLRSLLPSGLIAVVGLLLLYVGATFEQAVWLFDEATLPTDLGLRRLVLGLVLSSSLPLAAMAGALVAMTPRRIAWCSRLLALLVPLALVATMAWIGHRFVLHCHSAWELDKRSLNEAASLALLPRPLPLRRALVLRPAGGEAGDPVDQRERVQWYEAAGEVDLTPGTIARLDDYLARRRGRTTSFTELAMETRRRIAGRNWQILEFREICLENSLTGGSLLNPLYLFSSLDHAPVTARNQELLRMLSDERLFVVKGTSSLRMAKAWVTFGDLQAARRWYQRARRELPTRELRGWQVPDTLALTQGRIRGRIRGAPTQGSRIGLYHMPEGQKVVDLNQLTYIKGAAGLSADGSFAFDHLPGGRYYLALLLPPGLEGTFDVQGGGPLGLSPARPAIDVGEIRVMSSRRAEGLHPNPVY